MATTEAIALSYLSPYKLSSPSSITKDLKYPNTQPRSYMIQHTSHMLHKFTSSSKYIGVRKELLQPKLKYSSSGSKASF